MATNDPTPGSTKAWTATGAAVIGGAISKIVIKILQHSYPWFLDDTTAQAIDDVATAVIVGAATYIVPHQLNNPS